MSPSKSKGKKTFEFLRLHQLPPKPRKTSVVEFRGPYYFTVTTGYLKNILEDWGEYVDGFKFAGGSMRLLQRETTKKMIDLCHDHDVYVSTGGFVERVIAQGAEAVDMYLEECKSLEFDMVEVSSGLANIPIKDKVAIVKQVKKLGMKPKPEVTLMQGAGAGTHIIGYETEQKMRPVKEALSELDLHFKAGAHIIMIESEGLTEDLPPEKWRKDLIKKLVEKFGYHRLMFEASDPPVFKWYLQSFGRDVNLFIDHSQIVEFNAWRLGLWGDPAIWKGKKLSYPAKK